MGLSSLHKLVQMIREGAVIEDADLDETIGPDALIAIPLDGGGERHLPSGEILTVLAQGAGLTIDDVLTRNFRMNHDEISAAREFINLVQFSGTSSAIDGQPTEEPIQPLDF